MKNLCYNDLGDHMNKLYISDLDGTLLLDGAKVGEKTKQTINELIDKGANITFCTARNIAQCKDILSNFNLKLPVALVNGALVYDLKSECYIKKSFISKEIMVKILEVYKKYGHYPFLFCLEENGLVFEYVNENNIVGEKFIELFGKNFKSVNKRPDYILGDNTVYISSFETHDFFEPIYNELCEIEGITVQFYYDVNSTYWLIEIMNSESNKRTAAKFIKEHCNADVVIAFGDNDNDIPMIEFADTGVCVKNATEKLKKIANVTIGDNNSEAVADFIDKNFQKM